MGRIKIPSVPGTNGLMGGGAVERTGLADEQFPPVETNLGLSKVMSELKPGTGLQDRCK
jgi:hypothetical protein